MSLISTLSTAASGLRVASTGMNVTGHNVSNATTDGYSQRSVRASTMNSVERYGFSIGTGATVGSISRASDFLISERYLGAMGLESRTSARYQTLSAVEASFDDVTESGPAALLNQFFDSLSRLSQTPGDRSLRQEVVTTGGRFTDSMNRLATDLNASRQNVYEELQQSIPDINLKLEQIAEMNARAMAATSELGGGDFMDQRDQLIGELAEEFGFTADFGSDGSAQVFLGSHAVVTGATHRTLGVQRTAVGDPQIDLETGSATIDVTALAGGYFGGRVDADTAINGFLTELNTFVDTLGTAFNAQHAGGFDLTGAPGGAFFQFTVGAEAATFSLDALLAGDPDLIAAAGAATAAAGDGDNLAALIGVESLNLFGGGSRNATEALGAIYSSVGRAVSTADLENLTAQVSLEDIAALKDAVTGVDLDKEATDLLAWQASYEASARVVSTTNSMLGELMEIVR